MSVPHRKMSAKVRGGELLFLCELQQTSCCVGAPDKFVMSVPHGKMSAKVRGSGLYFV